MTTVNVKNIHSRLTNHVTIVLDSSSSMRDVERATVDAFNRNLADLKEEAAASGQNTTLTLVIFGDPDVRVEFAHVPIMKVSPMTYSNFHPNYNTPLFDGVGTAIETLAAFEDAGSNNTSFLVITITDGDENASENYTAGELTRLMKQKNATDRWTFAFQVPRGGREALLSKAPAIPEGNIIEWDQTKVGVERAATANSVGLRSYFASRASGQRSVSNFYTTDLSNVKKRDLKSLSDVSNNVKIWTVDKEAEIKPFVLRKNRGTFTIGAGYYELMKTEKIQSYKQVLLQDITTGKIYAGDEARELIGLPAASAGVDGKVSKGNHGNFLVFIQSTSPNRKLPRGTKLAYRLDHTTPSTPTWTPAPTTGLRSRVTRSRR